MVSKTKTTITIITTTTTTKRTPTRIRPKQQQQPSPPSSLRRSLRSCRRRLIGILSLLSPTNRSRHRLGFHRLSSSTPNPIQIQKPEPLPLPLLFPSKPTLFLDLDETLIHSSPHSPPPQTPYDFIVHPIIDSHVIPFYVSKRPLVDSFLQSAAESFEIVVFTAGLREYASLVLDRLDPKGRIFSHRLYRDSCTELGGGKLVKDLSRTGRDLGKVVIFDDNPNCYSLQPGNAVPVRPFLGDVADREMERLMGFFEKGMVFEDLRDAVKCYLSGLKLC